MRLDLPIAGLAIFICLCAALLITVVSYIVPFTVAGQAYLLLALLVAFRHWPPMRRWIARMPIPHRMVFLGMVASILIGHFTLNGRTYFPFVAWEIFPFVAKNDPVTCREFSATTASGKTVRFLVEQLFPSIVQYNPPEDNDSEAMTHLVQAMAKVYNLRHADDPVRQVDLVRVAVRLRPAKNEQPSCEFLKRFDISSAPSS